MKKIIFSALLAVAHISSIVTAHAEEKPRVVNIGFQKANIFALLKYRARSTVNSKSRDCRALGGISGGTANAGRAQHRQHRSGRNG